MTVALDAPLVERALRRAAHSRLIPGNRVIPLVDGPATFDAMLALIDGAERAIHLENYIIRSDATGWRFARALAAKARSGCAVRVIYDWLGSVATSRRLWRYLREAGVETRGFNPPRLIDVFANLTRDHRKLLVVDGVSAVLGGLCLGDEWSGDPERGIEPWRDTAVRIDGPAAGILDHVFGGMWARTGPPLTSDNHPSEVPDAGTCQVMVVAGTPGRVRIYRVIELLSAGVVDRMWLTDAYMVAPRPLFQAIVTAAREGVDVRLLVPSSSDLPIVRNLTRIGYRDLLEAGVRIFEWVGPMLHAKTQVSDGRWTRVGSSNMNAASLVGNYELDVLIDDPGVAEAFEGIFRKDIVRSCEVVAESRGRGWRPGRRSRLVRFPEPPTAAEGAARGLHHRRRRVLQTVQSLAVGARRSVFLPASAALAILAVLFVILPTLMGYIVGGLLLWLAAGAVLEAFRRRSTPPV